MSKEHYKRSWLNKDEGTAFIISSVKLDQSTYDQTWFLDATLSIADCSRTIHLELDAYDLEQLKKRMAKMDVLYSHLDAIYAQMEEALTKLVSRKEVEAATKKAREAAQAKKAASPS